MIVPIFIHDRIYIPYNKDTNPLITKLKKEFSYSNPDFHKKSNMGYYVTEEERYICNYKFTEYKNINCFSVSRGGMQKVKKHLESLDCKYQFIDERLVLDPVEGYENNVVLRDDQNRLLKAMLKKENCLIRSPCGSGKLEVCLKIIEKNLQTSGPVLAIVWQRDLMDEWIERTAKRFDISTDDIGVIQGQRRKIRPITIAMQQTLRKCANEYKDYFSTVICDEVQRFAAHTFVETVDLFPAKYRFGVSESETRKDKKEFYIYDIFGEVADEIQKSKLIDKGAIHEVIIRVIETNYNFFVDDIPYNEIQNPRDKRFPEMLNDLYQDEERNNLIWEFMEPVLKSGLSSVVMSHRVNHVLYFDDFIRNKGYKCGKVLGGVKYKEESRESLQAAKVEDIQVTVGSIPIRLGQGVDVPCWCRGFLLTPIPNNWQQFGQIAGRLTRPADGKTEAIMYVFWDKQLHPYFLYQLKKHYRHVDLFNRDTNQFERISK